MTTQINYYELDKLEASSFMDLYKASLGKVQTFVGQGKSTQLDELAISVFNDETLSKFLLLLARLPVFSQDFYILLKDTLEALSILKKLKYFANIKIRETLYLLVKLSVVSVDESTAATFDVTKFFSAEANSAKVEKLVDMKFKGALKQDNALFAKNKAQKNMYIKEFEKLGNIEPHAIFPTSIYRQSDGCTVASEDSQTIEAVMSTTLTTSIRICSHVLGYNNSLLAEIYRPLGRAVIVLDDKLSDATLTSGPVDSKTNHRAVLGMEKDTSANFVNITIGEQINRYFAHHNVETKVLIKSGNEADKGG